MVAHGGRYESYAPVGYKYSIVQKFKVPTNFSV